MFDRNLYNLEIPAFVVAGLSSLILGARPDLNLEKLKLVLSLSAESNQLLLDQIRYKAMESLIQIL